MLKVGFVEVLQLWEGSLHILIERGRIPNKARANKKLRFSECRYRNAPGCAFCDIDDISMIARGYSALLPAHEEAIRIAARSPIHTTTTQNHSPGLITFISQHLNARLFQPAYLDGSSNESTGLPEELTDEEFEEGGAIQVLVNRYERDPAARRQCITHYGARCTVCGISLAERYGSEVNGLIHVHHLTPIASVRKKFSIDPIRDLRPVCPNCHAVIHTTKPTKTIEQVKQMAAGKRAIGGRQINDSNTRYGKTLNNRT
jgi:hypothetical protein